MKRIFCMVLIMMLALSCSGAFARSTYDATDTKVDVEISAYLSYYFTWIVPGDDLDMTGVDINGTEDGDINWGYVGVDKTTLNTNITGISIYAGSWNDFNLVHETKSEQKIPYVMTIDDVGDITEQTDKITGVVQNGDEEMSIDAYFIMKTRTTLKKMCHYEIDDKRTDDDGNPLECGWYKDTVTFFCSIK